MSTILEERRNWQLLSLLISAQTDLSVERPVEMLALVFRLLAKAGKID